MTSSTVTLDDPPLLLEQFLTGYWSARTRANYAFIIGRWFTWCAGHGHDPMRDADPRVLERWVTDMQLRPYAANTIAARVSAVSAFYRWCVREQLLNRNPVEVIRRPARPSQSATASLTRHQLTDWLSAAERRGGDWWAAAMLLGLNGLRCGELIACESPTSGVTPGTTPWRCAPPRATSRPSSRSPRRRCKPSRRRSPSAAAGRCCAMLLAGA